MPPLRTAAVSEPAGITGIDLINLFSAASSIILAVVALTLSIFFFVQSKKDAERSDQSATEISSSVDRLEKLFDSLYSDTFSMMRDTVADMRKHVWTAVPARTNLRNGEDDAEGVKETDREQAELLQAIGEVSARLGLADAQIGELRTQLAPLVSQTLTTAGRDDDFATRAIRSEVRRFASIRGSNGRTFTLATLTRLLKAEPGEVVDVLFELAREGYLDWDGAPDQLATDTPIRWIPREEREARKAEGGMQE